MTVTVSDSSGIEPPSVQTFVNTCFTNKYKSSVNVTLLADLLLKNAYVV